MDVSSWKNQISSEDTPLSKFMSILSLVLCDIQRITHNRLRKYFFNQDFFSKWSPDMAYTLGFTFADGSINKNAVSLYQKHPDILKQIAAVLEYDGPLHLTGVNKGIHTLVLSSRKMVRSLGQYKLKPGSKTYKARLPGCIKFPADFIRGFFDGDGHGGWYKKRSKRYLSIGFTSGSSQLLKDVIDLIPVKMRGPYGPYKRRASYSINTASQTDAIKLRQWMYAGITQLRIERKRKKLFCY
jgi:hypothetical protein